MKIRLLLLIALLATGCGHTRRLHVVTGSPQPAYAGNVQVFMDGAPLPPSFQEIAIVQAIGAGMHADMAHVVDGLRLEAAALGANAIIRIRIDQGSRQASGTAVAVRVPE